MNRDEFLRLSAADKRRFLSAQEKSPGWCPEPEQRHAPFALTEMQQAFVAGRKLRSERAVSCQFYLEMLFEELDEQRVERALNALVARHAMLATRVEGRTQQVSAPPHYEIASTRSERDGSFEEQLAEVRAELTRSHDPAVWQPFSVRIVALHDGRKVLCFSIDELVADAASVSLLLREWEALYEDPAAELAPPTVEFRDYVGWLRRLEQSEGFQRDLEYWCEKLTPLPESVSFVAGHEVDLGVRKRVGARLDDSGPLSALARKQGVTLNTLLVTLFADTLAEVTGTQRFSLLRTFHNRVQEGIDASATVGPFMSSQVFVCDASADTLAERARAHQAQHWRDLEHWRVGAVRVFRELSRRGVIKRGQALPVVFTSTIGTVKPAREGWFARRIYSITQTPQVYLDHQIHEDGAGLSVSWDYAPHWLPSALAARAFAAYLRRLQQPEARPDAPLPFVPASQTAEFATTSLQRAYVLARRHMRGDARSCSVYQEYDFRALDLERLERAWQTLVDHHPMLRTVIGSDGRQRPYTGDTRYRIAEHAGDFEAEAARVRNELLGRVHELDSWPMFSLEVVRGDEGARLCIEVDGLIADGKSLELLYRQLFALYADPTWQLPPATLHYADYIASLEAFARSEAGAQAQAYWKDKLARLPSGPALPPAKSQRGRPSERVRFDADVPGWAAVSAHARALGLEPSMITLAAYIEALAEQASDPAFTVVVANWDRLLAHPEVGQLVGDFCSLAWVARDPTLSGFAAQVRHCQRSVHADLAHSGVSGADVMRLLAAKKRAPSSLGVVFTRPLRHDDADYPEGVALGYGKSRTPQVLLDHLCVERGDALHLHWDVAAAELDSTRLERAFASYVARLRAIASAPQRYLDDEQRPQARAEETSVLTIHRWFEQTVQRFPDRIAVSAGERSLSYRELNERANQLAHSLRASGVVPEQVVGLWVDRDLETIVGILGILKAGAAYLPLDVKYPRERTAYILDHADARFLLTTASVEAGELAAGRKLLRIDADWDALIAPHSRANPEPLSQADNLAYVIYTSGSTGKPKGVMVENAQVTRLFTQTAHWYGFNERDVFTMTHSHSFDVSVFEIFGALLHGARVVVVPFAVSRSFDALHELLVRERVTVLSQTPTAFRYLLEADQRSPRSQELGLRFVIFAGERLDFALLKPWFARHGEATTMVNMYGITETTVHSTFRAVRAHELDQPSLIGVPIPDLTIHLLDAQRKPVARGEIGEIYIEGPGVTRGYSKRPDLTAERFLDNPFGRAGKLYKSGDLARYLDGGELEYIGRADLQVQLRGFRVELGEIEAALLTCPEVCAAAVVLDDSNARDPKLVAFLVPSARSSKDAAAVRRALRTRLPDYMVPSLIEWLVALPLTAVGKLDRSALQALLPGAAAPVTAVALPAPPGRSALERLDEVLKVVARELGLAQLDPDADIFDLGATSLSVSEIAAKVESELGLSLPVELWLEHPSVRETCTHGLPPTRTLANEALPVQEAPPAPPRVESRRRDEEFERALRAAFASELEGRQLGLDDDFFDFGATSLSLANVASAFEHQTGAVLGVDVLLDRPTLREVLAHLHEQAPPPNASGALNGPLCVRTISQRELAQQLSVVRSLELDGKPRRRYASAGGKYALDVYLEVHAGGVQGLAAGLYRYLPDAHALARLGTSSLREAHHPAQHAALAAAPYSLYYVAQLSRLRPVYGDFAETFALLDVGYLEACLLGEARRAELAYEASAALDGARVAQALGLRADQRVVGAAIARIRTESLTLGGPLDAHFTAAPKHVSKATLDALYADFKYEANPREAASVAEPMPAADVPLPAVELDAARVRARLSQRDFRAGALPAGVLEAWLSSAQRERDATLSALGLSDGLCLYVHLKQGALQGFSAGVYRFERGMLMRCGELDARTLKRCHSPFNRGHFEQASFSLWLAADLASLERAHGPHVLAWLLREAGRLGQRLMESQQESGLGVVPIGGLNFAPIKQACGGSEGWVVLHSMIGGARAEAVAEVAPVVRSATDYVPIAIIGLSGRYGDADDLDAFWQTLREGRCALTRAAEARPWLTQDARWHGGFLRDVDAFDANLFKIAPAEADTLEPEVRLTLEEVWSALEDAGYAPRKLAKRDLTVGAFLGCMYSHYRLLADDPELQQAMSLQSYSGIVNRVSHFFDLRGPSVAVDAACASSLLSVHLAAESLQRGDCDVALAGGVNLTLHASKYVGLSALGLLGSRADRAAYSQSDGFIPGEGVGIAVLKPLARAQADGDRIYAVIRGSASNHSGRTGAFNAPSASAQERLIRKALERAGVRPEQLDYLESAAAGSPLGDPVELSALTRVFGDGSRRPNALPLGSLKGNVGHLEAASGIAQLSKVILQMHHQTLVPSLHSEPRNPALDFARAGVALQQQAAPWSSAKLRLAGVGSFGAGGSNAYLVVEEYARRSSSPSTGPVLLALSAHTRPALERAAARLAERLERGQLALADVAYTLSRREPMHHRVALVARDPSEAARELRAFAAGEASPRVQCGAALNDGLVGCLSDDADTRLLLAGWARAGKLDKLATAFASGLDVDLAFQAEGAQLVRLPSYPFERSRHWLGRMEDAAVTLPESVCTEEELGMGRLLELLGDVLRIPSSRIELNLPLAEQGMNSLLGLRLLRVLSARFAGVVKLRDVIDGTPLTLHARLGQASHHEEEPTAHVARPEHAEPALS